MLLSPCRRLLSSASRAPLQPFHLAFPVRDKEETRRFYVVCGPGHTETGRRREEDASELDREESVRESCSHREEGLEGKYTLRERPMKQLRERERERERDPSPWERMQESTLRDPSGTHAGKERDP